MITEIILAKIYFARHCASNLIYFSSDNLMALVSLFLSFSRCTALGTEGLGTNVAQLAVVEPSVE